MVVPTEEATSGSDEDLYSGSEALVRMQPRRRRNLSKIVGAVAATMGLLVATVVFMRGRASASMRMDDGVQLKATMKVRGRYDDCSARGGDCTQTHCCKGTNEYCWRVDATKAMCQVKAGKGWLGEELEGPNTVVPVDTSQQGNSLFCFTVYRQNKGTSDFDNEALRLLQGQKGYGVGIFACDMWRVYSDVEGMLDDEHSLIKVTEAPGDSFYQSKRPESGGWGGHQWVNTPLFRQVWHKIYSEFPSGYYTKHWVVKADPDTVFIPGRLAARLAAQPVPYPGLYIEHCKGVDFGFFGSLEVMSRKAATTLFENMDTCYHSELSWKTDEIAEKYGWYGEDLFAQRCMDLHGVQKIWQFELVADGTCPMGRPWGLEEEKQWVPDPVTCQERDTFVAFKPLKKPEDFSKCLTAINPAITYAL